jgi:hypothetical protein
MFDSELVTVAGPAPDDFDALFTRLEADPRAHWTASMTWPTCRWRTSHSECVTIWMPEGLSVGRFEANDRV